MRFLELIFPMRKEASEKWGIAMELLARKIEACKKEKARRLKELVTKNDKRIDSHIN